MNKAKNNINTTNDKRWQLIESTLLQNDELRQKCKKNLKRKNFHKWISSSQIDIIEINNDEIFERFVNDNDARLAWNFRDQDKSLYFDFSSCHE